ncbi:MAG: 2OG-Fe(II) oxygenase [Methylotenera sp.]|nr:2OG-Fe(II) oxygenase [Methylotenera sp.]
MINDYSVQNIEELISKITQQGFAAIDDFLPISTALGLAAEISALNVSALLQDAGTGRLHQMVNKNLRGDLIYWLNEADATHAQRAYFTQMEILRLALNQALYLGLFALESHLALYPAGAAYKKHIDRFKSINDGKPLRQISAVLYLNPDWHDDDGGHLRLYMNGDSDSEYLDILPIGSRLVVFLSDTFYHEVLPASRDRMSLTAWFLTR